TFVTPEGPTSSTAYWSENRGPPARSVGVRGVGPPCSGRAPAGGGGCAAAGSRFPSAAGWVGWASGGSGAAAIPWIGGASTPFSSESNGSSTRVEGRERVEIGATGGGASNSRASTVAGAGAEPSPPGTLISTWRPLRALSWTEARTRIASVTPQSQVFAPTNLRSGPLRGTGRQSIGPAPATWYSRLNESSSRFSSWMSHLTATLAPRRPAADNTSVGGAVSTTTFRLGSAWRSSEG